MISAMGEGKARTVHECALEGDLAALEGLVSSSCSRSSSCSCVLILAPVSVLVLALVVV